MLHVLRVNTFRGSLQENSAAVLDQRDCREKDHDGDEDTDSWISIVTLVTLHLPDDDSRNDDTNIVDGIS